MSKWYSKTEKVFQKMGESNKNILSPSNAFDLKKELLLNLNVFKSLLGGWFSFYQLFLLFFLI